MSDDERYDDERDRRRGRDRDREDGDNDERDRRRGRDRDREDADADDRADDDERSETLELSQEGAAYLYGRSGSTMQRLCRFSGCKIEMGSDKRVVEIRGASAGRALARLCIDILLQQRNGGRLDCDWAAIEKRDDATTIDVPIAAVGFLMGSKGATLRDLEGRHEVFMFFDNDTVRKGAKRLYVLGGRGARGAAAEECDRAVELKMSGRGQRVPSWQDYRAMREGSGGGGGGGERYFR